MKIIFFIISLFSVFLVANLTKAGEQQGRELLRWAIENSNSQMPIQIGNVRSFRWEFPTQELEDYFYRAQELGAVPEEFWNDSLVALTQEQRLSLYTQFRISLNRPFDKERKTIFPVMILFDQNRLLYSLLAKNVDTNFLIQHLSEQISFSKVTYDNEKAQHIFKDEQFYWKVKLLYERLFEISADELSLNSRRILEGDTRGFDIASRIEPLDLLSHFSKDNIPYLEEYEVSPQSLVDLSKTFIRNVLGLDPSTRPYPISIFRRKDGRNVFLFVCAHRSSRLRWGEQEIEFDLHHRSLSYRHETLSNLIPQIETGITWKCGDDDFKVRLEDEEDKRQLPFPPELDFENAFETNQLNVLVTFSIIDQFTDESWSLFKRYIETVSGYKVTEELKAVENFENKFRQDFLHSDIYFPVAHIRNRSILQIGVHRDAQMVILEKDVFNSNRPEKPLSIKVKLYLPPIKSTATFVELNRQEMAELFRNRRKQRNDPLLAMNFTCNSGSFLKTWMDAYKCSLSKETEVESLEDIPVVIASDRGFDAQTTEAQISQIWYVIKTLDLLAKSVNAEELIRALNTKTKAKNSFEAVSNVQKNRKALFNFSEQLFVVEDKKENQWIF